MGKNCKLIECKICKKEILSFGFPAHSKKIHDLTSKKYYDKYVKTKEEGGCIICFKETEFSGISTGYRKYCSCKCISLNKELKKENIEKRKNTCFKKYGGNSPASSKEVIEKMKQTCLKKYGVESNLSLEEIKIKNKNRTLLKKQEMEKKKKDTCFKKYGVDHVMKDFLIKENHKNSFKNNKNNFCKFPSQKQLSEYSYLILQDKDKLEDLFLKNNKIRKSTCEELKIAFSTLTSYFIKYDLYNKYIEEFKSDYEKEIFSFLITFLSKDYIKERDRKRVKGIELDFFVKDYNIALEFNGDYWHSDVYKDKNYHLNKSKLCQNEGIFLYHIFEKDWNNKKEIIKSQIKNLFKYSENKIYARNCVIKIIEENEISKSFLENNHLQGNINSTIKIGLFFKEELVSIMTFGFPRFNNNYQYELLRFCNKINFNIIGGASKLFKYFLKNFSPKSIISYSNIHNQIGKIYKILEFTLIKESEPSYFYHKGNYTLSRYQCQKHILINKYKQEIKNIEEKSEEEIMKELGYNRVYDCGNKVWEIKL